MVQANKLLPFFLSFFITLTLGFSLFIYKPRPAYAALPALAVPVVNTVGRFIVSTIAKRAAQRGLATAANDAVYVNTVASVSNVAKTIGNLTAANSTTTTAYLQAGLRVAGRPTWRGIASQLGIGFTALTLPNGEFSEQLSSTTNNDIYPGIHSNQQLATSHNITVPIQTNGYDYLHNPASTTNPYYVWHPDTAPTNYFPEDYAATQTGPHPDFNFYTELTTPGAPTWYISSNSHRAILTEAAFYITELQCYTPGAGWYDQHFPYGCWALHNSYINPNNVTYLDIPIDVGREIRVYGESELYGDSLETTWPITITLNTNSNSLGVQAYPMSFIDPQVRVALDTVPMAQTDALQLVNALLNQASALPDYQGLPFSLSDPITAADLAPLPSINAYFSPLSELESPPDYLPIIPFEEALPEPEPEPEPPLEIDWGQYTAPEFANPQLEDTPTGQQILQPILDWLSNSTPQIADVTGVCPTPSFSVWDNDYSYSVHCDLFEQFRVTIASFMMLCWTIFSFKITMSA